MTLFIGNLDQSVRQEELNELFSEFDDIRQIKIMKDPYSGESKGFAFVELNNPAQEAAIIRKLDNKKVAGKNIAVSRAKSKDTGKKTSTHSSVHRNYPKKNYNR